MLRLEPQFDTSPKVRQESDLICDGTRLRWEVPLRHDYL
jgi:hypothetical protein